MFNSEAVKLHNELQLQKLAELLGTQFSLDPKQLLEIAKFTTEVFKTGGHYCKFPQITKMIWNTGRYYAPEGQIIHAQIMSLEEVLADEMLNNCEQNERGMLPVKFSDKTRNLHGVVWVWRFSQDVILKAYDRGGYGDCQDFTLGEPPSE